MTQAVKSQHNTQWRSLGSRLIPNHSIKFKLSSSGLLTPCSVVIRIPTFYRSMLPPYWGWRPLKRWYLTTTIHGVTTFKNSNFRHRANISFLTSITLLLLLS